MITRSVTMIALLFLLPFVSFQGLASEKSKIETLDERTITAAIEKSPTDYLAAVVTVMTPCELSRDGDCFDRVRILDLIAQSPDQNPKRAVGDTFHLFSGSTESSAKASPGSRYLLFVVPISTSDKPIGYGARLLGVSVNAKDVDTLKKTVNAVRKKLGV